MQFVKLFKSIEVSDEEDVRRNALSCLENEVGCFLLGQKRKVSEPICVSGPHCCTSSDGKVYYTLSIIYKK